MFREVFLFLCLYFLTSINLFSQNQENIYLSGNGTDKAHSITKNGDNYLICGSTRLSSNTSNEAILFEMTESGIIVWTSIYGYENSTEAFDVCSSASGKIGLTGYKWTDFMHDPFMYLVGADGDIIKEEYILDNMSGIGFSVIEDNDGGFSFSGYSAQNGTLGGQVFLTKMNNYGDVLWTKEYGDTPEEHFYSHIQTQDGGYLLLGTQNGFMFNFIWREFHTTNSSIYIIKTDSHGNEIWNTTISGEYNDLAKCVKQALDGGYYILGSTQSIGAGSFDMYLIKINENGELEWEKTFGQSDFEYGYDMCITEDNYLYCCGVSRTMETESVDIYIVKTDLEGNMIWEKYLGGEYSEYGYGIESTSTNGCIIVGATNDISFGNGSYNLLVMKLNRYGEIEKLENGDFVDISVFPNPAKDFVYINILKDYQYSYTYSIVLLDIMGKELYRQDNINDSFVLNVSQFTTGVYILVINDKNDEQYIKKIVIQK